jgi:hypothetical protein
VLAFLAVTAPRRLALIAAFAVGALGCGRTELTSRRAPAASSDARVGAAGTSGAAGTRGASGTSGIAGTSGAAGTYAIPDGGPGVFDVAPLPRKPNGAKCASPAECLSGFCAEGVCCSHACDRTCSSCTVVGQVGTCTLAVSGTSCGPGLGCLNEYQVFQDECTGSGQCRSVVVQSCAPYKCDSSSGCRASCDSDNDCIAPARCIAGLCLRPLRLACAIDAECATGFCVQGVCCNARCPGPCFSCAVPGREGMCLTIEKGAPDPRGICKVQGPETCGDSGLCDGNGGCAWHPPGTVCAEVGCPANRSICDGRGTCVPANATCP